MNHHEAHTLEEHSLSDSYIDVSTKNHFFSDSPLKLIIKGIDDIYFDRKYTPYTFRMSTKKTEQK